jgi:hypothetical protein
MKGMLFLILSNLTANYRADSCTVFNAGFYCKFSLMRNWRNNLLYL